VDEKQGLLHGEVVGITDVVTFEGKTTEELVQAFRDSVDDYLEFCAERSEAPEKPYSGKFLVRLPPSLHRKAALAAKRTKESLNAWVREAVKDRLAQTKPMPLKRARTDQASRPTRKVMSKQDSVRETRPATGKK